MVTLNLKVNGKDYQTEALPDEPLLWVLRDRLGLTGTKFGCGEGHCGSCTVLLNGAPVRSCTLPAVAVQGMELITIEGLSEDGTHPLQQAWKEHDVPQCGYCQSGQIMTAAALLQNNPTPTEAEIDTAMAGNICRCGTYPRIKEAILAAAKGGEQ